MNDWSFKGFGPRFDMHVERHLPHYHLAQSLVADASRFMLPNGGIMADVGCSTGSTVASIARRNADRRFTSYMYDIDQSMLDQAEARLDGNPSVDCHYCLFNAEHDAYRHEQADLTVFMWTLQFLNPSLRTNVLRSAREHAADSGAVLVASKVRVATSRFQQIADDLTSDWKSVHGAGPEEIIEKSKSLRGVMILNTASEMAQQLTQAGWFEPTVLFRWNSWILMGAWAFPQGSEFH